MFKMFKSKSYIDGKFIDSKIQIEIISPLNLKTCAILPGLNKKDIDKAFDSARKAFKNWKGTSDELRINYILSFANLLNNKKEQLAKIMEQEIGKSFSESLTEIERSIEYINKTIDVWNKIKLNYVNFKNKKTIQKRVPLGVVLAISPFNYPVNLSLVKIIPALVAGNTVVFKAATNGSITGGFIAKLIHDAKIPKGVFNYVIGRGRDIGDSLISNKQINMISFTGGIKVGKNIAKKSGMIPLVLELGGNDAAYVKDDANIELAIKEIIGGAFGYAGQRCTAIKRVILHEKISKKIISGLKKELNNLQVDKVIDLKAANYLEELYNDSLKRGDEIILNGSFIKNNVSPILIKTNTKSRIWNEEQFGPILPLVVVKNDKEALETINNTNFGLQNSIFTSDIDWGVKIAGNIESGSLNINAKSSRGPDLMPFSGIKDSGYGTQGVSYTLESMTRILNIVNNSL